MKFSKILALSLALAGSAASLGAQNRDALAEYRAGNFQAAVDITRAEIAARPDNMDAYTVQGWSLLKLNQYREALNVATEALKVRRYDYRIIEIAGEAQFYLGRPTEALKHFEEYAALAPTGDRIETVYYFMGEIFLQLGEFHRADIAFSTALYHAPRTARWHERLGYARLQAKDYRYAVAAYDEALRLNPGLVEAQRGRAQAQQALSAAAN